jgi:S1-C subfamily serine protease
MKHVLIFLFLLFACSAFASDIDNNALIEKSSLTKNESKIRDSAVKIITPNGMGSGTYTVIAKNNVVLTAAHVVDDLSSVVVEGRNGEKVNGDVVYVDTDNDFAIVKVPNLATRTPVKFVQSQLSLEDMVGENINYTGFPNGHDLFTMRGSVAGIEKGYIVLQSYAWMGASGSGVFNSKGEIVGILVAVDMVRFDRTHHIVESMVWIVPIKNIELRLVESVLSKMGVK